MGDAVMCAKAGQHTPSGYYNIERMLLPINRAQGQIGVCGSCIDARGIDTPPVLEALIDASVSAVCSDFLHAPRDDRYRLCSDLSTVFVIQAVPAPGAVAGLALVGAGMRRRRRD